MAPSEEPFPMPKKDRYVGRKNREGVPHGQGRMELANGDLYDGEWAAGEMSGRGKHRWASGAVYEGDWLNGVREGRGRYCFTPRGTTYYEGDFKNDKREGTGVYMWSNDEKYEGGFVNDMRHGPGRFLWAGGREDISVFAEGRMVGEGVRWSADRQVAWKTQDGQQVEDIPVQAATQLEQSILGTTEG